MVRKLKYKNRGHYTFSPELAFIDFVQLSQRLNQQPSSADIIMIIIIIIIIITIIIICNPYYYYYYYYKVVIIVLVSADMQFHIVPFKFLTTLIYSNDCLT